MEVRRDGRMALRVGERGRMLPYYSGLTPEVPDTQHFPDLGRNLRHLNVVKPTSDGSLRDAIAASVAQPLGDGKAVVIVGASSNPWVNDCVAVFVSD